MSDSATVLPSAEDTNDQVDQGSGEEAQARTCVSPSDAAVDRAGGAAHSDCGSSSAKSSPDTSHLKNKPQQTVVEEEKVLGHNWGLAKHVQNVSADMEKFCGALKRPDFRAKKLNISIRDKIVVRASRIADHVLVMGTVDFMLDPLPCPYAEQTEACKAFRASAPSFLKAHLQAKHDLRNVILNFVCPCPAKFNGKKSCPVVRFDPGEGHMHEHLEKYHRKYYDAVTNALVAADEDDAQLMQKHERFMRRTRRLFFPGWTRRKEELFPSQIIPDKVVIPTKISEEGEIMYICNIDPCRRRKFRPPHAAAGVHAHVWTEHQSRLDLRTSLYHQCPAAKCRETVRGCARQLESHVKAVHPELLGPRTDYSEAAKKKRKDLEDSIPAACIGEALANDPQADEGGQLFLQRYTCPVKKCDKVFLGLAESARKYMVWHVGADHEADWNVQESPVT
ncbi:uncharacterized protein LOC129587367 [Paramacrobiotus metropolitanus]|uniref:uncharacterized protein LOC129587367 n=1 Tax=Paramacrobiotus metropolitanus TaxID=2943436 RepID=UPI00244631B1|nr:uncharacterized protein LOC129587367 [Paramacrobiotus metropolitanus]